MTPSKSTKTRLPRASARQLEAAPIDGDEFVGLVVEAVPGQLDVGVRDDHLLESGVVEVFAVRGFGLRRAIAPVAVDGQNDAATLLGGTVLAECFGYERACRRSASGLEKIATIH